MPRCDQLLGEVGRRRRRLSSAAACMRVVDELGGREQPGDRARARARHWSSASNSGSLSSWRSRLYASGRPLSVARKPVRSPISRPGLAPRELGDVGVLLLRQHRRAGRCTRRRGAGTRTPRVDHSTISSPRRDRCTCVSAATNSASATKSRSETASSELSNRRGEAELGGDVRRDRAAGSNRRARPRRAATRRRARARRASDRRRGASAQKCASRWCASSTGCGALEVRVARAA